jgi:di/tricarboxylate transporter
VKVKRLFVSIILAIILIGLLLSGLNDTAFSIEDVASSDKEVASNVSKASNSSASPTIMTTMTGALNE